VTADENTAICSGGDALDKLAKSIKSSTALKTEMWGLRRYLLEDRDPQNISDPIHRQTADFS